MEFFSQEGCPLGNLWARDFAGAFKLKPRCLFWASVGLTPGPILMKKAPEAETF